MRIFRGVALGIATTIFACGGSSDSASDASPEQACADAAEAVCSKLETCVPALFAFRWPSHDKCVERSKVTCPSTFMLKGTSATAASLEACVQAAGTASCEDIFRGVAACATNPGTQMNGMACFD